jgi:alkylation response protein AidB-like acyl-CoA dehydrogenase
MSETERKRVAAEVAELARGFELERAERQRRRRLAASDLDALAAAGYLRVALPESAGGLWRSTAESTRFVAELLRRLAAADSSLALVSAMHPAVLLSWLVASEAPEPYRAAWKAQRREIFEGVTRGAWWGTLSSEPGSGGDLGATRARAVRDGEGWRLFGEKHFGSGFGSVDRMVTTAVAEGEDQPDWFFVDVSGAQEGRVPGAEVTREWDGHGMTATQSHAVRFEGVIASRIAWPGALGRNAAATGPSVLCFFVAVTIGILGAAVATAREQLAPRRGRLRALEQVEWTRAETDAWLAVQAYEGMLRAVETGHDAVVASLRGKVAVSELAESALVRIGRVIGGASYARSSPFGAWAADLRALGWLRPPTPHAFEVLARSEAAP